MSWRASAASIANSIIPGSNDEHGRPLHLAQFALISPQVRPGKPQAKDLQVHARRTGRAQQRLGADIVLAHLVKGTAPDDSALRPARLSMSLSLTSPESAPFTEEQSLKYIGSPNHPVIRCEFTLCTSHCHRWNRLTDFPVDVHSTNIPCNGRMSGAPQAPPRETHCAQEVAIRVRGQLPSCGRQRCGAAFVVLVRLAEASKAYHEIDRRAAAALISLVQTHFKVVKAGCILKELRFFKRFKRTPSIHHNELAWFVEVFREHRPAND
ncbi:hypothetical protein B0H17DRAFT_1142924 [Mycena rosella]|uniref:Uncharacterized protein n=1 Tax=Mycena rosella TaxID=1033263 RepID=A0AAD7CW78_MYCRO|nr:hypothetical protein B0H17DRAFT_1142924 [Mycena rosella]